MADPGFDLMVGVEFVNGSGAGVGGWGKESLKVMSVELEVILSMFWSYFY